LHKNRANAVTPCFYPNFSIDDSVTTVRSLPLQEYTPNVYKITDAIWQWGVSMSLDARMSVALDFPPAKTVAFRNPTWCGFWAILMLTSGALIALLEDGRLHSISVVLFLYALQALIAECIGVRVSEGRFSAPQRFSHAFPQLVLWRTGGLLCDVNRVASISKRGNGGEVNIRWLGDIEVPVMLASRDVKLAFFEVLRQSRPEVAIYRKS
jgi:hypothetical protein